MNTSKTMTPLEYAKLILEKVSFSPKIFRKELRKALRASSKRDFRQLMTWCKEQFRSKN